MKKITMLLLGFIALAVHAQQPVEGSTYFLPKTAIQFHIRVEKTVYEPGELALYSEKYLKLKNVSMEPRTSYRVISVETRSVGVPDTAKQHMALIDKKHSIISLSRDDNGVLLAVNTIGRRTEAPKPFVSAPKPAPLNPHDFMNADILTAGTKPKMAELIASEIYEIRESRNQLTRGEADNMPKDGEQLRIMMANLDKQERALLQEFTGTVEKDTMERILTFMPNKETSRQLLFRFSSKLGMVDNDDLSGRPFYVTVEDLHYLPTLNLPDVGKKSKEESGIYVNLPGKIRLSLFDGTQLLGKFEHYVAQFGRSESLSGELFGKKFTTHIVLDPVTGNAQRLEVVPLQ